ncbi:MAG: glycosyltransferase family 39 protein [Acidobacteria bacterium]|nr:glycosyltransferase family 39 protein [Acidobacteriota bacterium]MBI3656719.1 glycosyltransferase family 39 protein [Acidobacteriota bacterium]
MFYNLVLSGLISLAIAAGVMGQPIWLDIVVPLLMAFLILKLLREQAIGTAAASAIDSTFGSTIHKHPYLSAAAIVSVITLYGYFNTLTSYFVGDDHFVLRACASMGLSDIAHLFRFGQPSFIRPIYWLSLLHDYFFWGHNPIGFHLTNVLLQIANALLLFGILISLTERIEIALLGAFLFATHPIHSEVIAWVAGRGDALVTLFGLAGLLYFIKSTRTGSRSYLGFFYLFFILALLTKETAVVLPIIAIILDFLVLKSVSRLTFFKRLLSYFPFCVILLAYLVWRYFLLHGLGGYEGRHFLNLSYSSLRAVFIGSFEYLLLPYNQSRLAPFPILKAILVVIIVSPLFAFASRHTPFKKLAIFSILFVPITMLPTHNLSYARLEPTLLHSRFFYLPSVGFCTLFAIALSEMLRRLGRLKFVYLALFSISYFFILQTNNFPWVKAGEYFHRASTTITNTLKLREPKGNASLYLLEMPNDYDSAMLFWGASNISDDQYFAHGVPCQATYLVNSMDQYTNDTFTFDDQHPLADLNLGAKDFIYAWNRKNENLEDLTLRTKAGLDCARYLGPKPPPAGSQELSLIEIHPKLKVINREGNKATVASTESRSGAYILYRVTDPAPPCSVKEIELRLSVTRRGGAADPNLEVFWASMEDTDYHPNKRVTLQVSTDSQAQTYKIPVTNNVYWIVGGPISQVGIRPKGITSISLEHIKLVYEQAEAPDQQAAHGELTGTLNETRQEKN